MTDRGSHLEVVASENGWTVVGEVDAHTAPALAEELSTLPDGAEIVADLSGVAFLDSSGLRVLVEATVRASASGQTLLIGNPTPAIRRIVEISGLSETLRFTT